MSRSAPALAAGVAGLVAVGTVGQAWPPLPGGSPRGARPAQATPAASGRRLVRPPSTPVPTPAAAPGDRPTAGSSPAPVPTRRVRCDVTGAPGHLAVLAADGRVTHLRHVSHDGFADLDGVPADGAHLVWTPDGGAAPVVTPIVWDAEAVHSLHGPPATRITGRVTDAAGGPLPGVGVAVDVPIGVSVDSRDRRLRPRDGAGPGAVDARGSVVCAGALVRRVRADAHGGFACDGVPWAAVTVQVAAAAGTATHTVLPGEWAALTLPR
jgi:hypothetical protein